MLAHRLATLDVIPSSEGFLLSLEFDNADE